MSEHLTTTTKPLTELQQWQSQVDAFIMHIPALCDEHQITKIRQLATDLDDFARYDKLLLRGRLWWYSEIALIEAWLIAAYVGSKVEAGLWELPFFCLPFWISMVLSPHFLKPDIHQLDRANHKHYKNRLLPMVAIAMGVPEPINDRRTSKYIRSLSKRRKRIKEKLRQLE